MGFSVRTVCPWEHTSCLCRGISLGCGRSGSDGKELFRPPKPRRLQTPNRLFPFGFLPSTVDRVASRVSSRCENLFVFK